MFKLVHSPSNKCLKALIEKEDNENMHFKMIIPQMLYWHFTITIWFSWGFKIIRMSKAFKSHCSLVQTLQLFQEKHIPPCPPNISKDMDTPWR